MATYYKNERQCTECGAQFWGTAGANFCSSSCRSRNWRAVQARERSYALADLCEQVVKRRKAGSGAYSKLLTRLLRVTAGELRARGWDPAELLSGSPDDPVTAHNESPGGIDGTRPKRVKWLHSPALELELLEEAIEHRTEQRLPTEWHEARRAELLKRLATAK